MIVIFNLSLIFAVFINCRAETYLNIGKTENNLVCGTNENCTIICNEDASCEYVRFTVLNNHITIKCSADFACYGSFVYASNVQSLTIIGDYFGALSYMRIHVDSNRQQSQTVINCTAVGACFWTQIQAINGKMNINCDGLVACGDCVVMMPMNINQIDNVVINVLGAYTTGYPLHIVSLYPINMNNIICINNCSLDTIWLYYGSSLSFCKASDKSCIQDMWNYNEDNVTVIDTYIDYVDLTDYNTTNQEILIILWEEEDTEISFSYLNTFSLVSIICFRCRFLTIDFDQVQNSILMVFGVEFDLCTIYGPQEYFEFNGYGGYSRYNHFLLMNTQYIQINSPRTYAIDDGFDKATIYTGWFMLGSSINVNIMCKYDLNCQYMEIVSTVDLINVPSLYNSWNIKCSVGAKDRCIDIVANFSQFGYVCQINRRGDPLQCVEELITNDDNYEDLDTSNHNVDVIFTLYGLTQYQQEFLINDYNEHNKMNVTTRYSVNRTILIIKLGYLSSYIDEYDLTQKPHQINLTFTDFVIHFDDVYGIEEDGVKIKSHIICKNKVICNYLSAITNQKYTFINTTNDILRNDYNNSNLQISVNIPISSLGFETWILWLTFSLSGLLICIIIIKLIQYIHRKYLEEYISHPLVLILGIGEYDELCHIKNPEFIGQVDDIPVEIDVVNLIKLFKNLNYQIIGDNNNDNDDIETYYTKDSFIKILKYTAQILSDRINEYDGLIVIISAHGIRNNIITSDYGLINKDSIHELFSIDYPNIRKIPRMFIFDCCDGDEERTYKINRIDGDDTGKYVALGDNDTKTDNESERKDDSDDTGLSLNPNYKLVTIHGANLGFQSKMNLDNGSYLIHEFEKTLSKSISNKKCFQKTKNLGEIFSHIQQYLHKNGKQQTINTFNNYTSYLFFKINPNKSENIEFNYKTENINQKLKRKTSLSERVDYASEMAQNIIKLLTENKNEKYIQNELYNDVISKNDKINQKKNFIINKCITYFNNDNDEKDYQIDDIGDIDEFDENENGN